MRPPSTPVRPTTNIRFDEHPSLSLPHSFPSTYFQFQKHIIIIKIMKINVALSENASRTLYTIHGASDSGFTIRQCAPYKFVYYYYYYY